MLAKPTIPLIPTAFDARLRRDAMPGESTLFPGWGVVITATRTVW
jgi:hypothetical protein